MSFIFSFPYRCMQSGISRVFNMILDIKQFFQELSYHVYDTVFKMSCDQHNMNGLPMLVCKIPEIAQRELARQCSTGLLFTFSNRIMRKNFTQFMLQGIHFPL